MQGKFHLGKIIFIDSWCKHFYNLSQRLLFLISTRESICSLHLHENIYFFILFHPFPFVLHLFCKFWLHFEPKRGIINVENATTKFWFTPIWVEITSSKSQKILTGGFYREWTQDGKSNIPAQVSRLEIFADHTYLPKHWFSPK